MPRMVALFFALFLETASASPFRVLVFPHHGTYPIPQGREAVVSKVKITSEEVCNQYAGQMNTKGEWEKVGDLIASENSFPLSVSSLRKKMKTLAAPADAFYFECTKPFKVNRGTGFDSYSYEGNFVALIDHGAVQIVNLIDSEKYLQGVVPSEVGAGWPAEALKAQAVAARTFAWWTVLNEKQNNAYDLDDTVQYQAYLGVSKRTTETDTAVSDTANQVMKYENKVIKAYFSADSGGKTESSKNAFGQNLPYCSIKIEEYDLSKTKTAWEKSVTLAEISAAFGKEIQSIEVLAADVNGSGRVNQVTMITADNKKFKIAGTVFRQALKLRSALFSLTTSTVNGVETVQIKGKGYGHGVGMAQVGAKEYASQLGWTFDQILKFYYTGITLESVTNDNLE